MPNENTHKKIAVTPIKFVVYIAFFRSADLYHSVAQLPTQVFTSRGAAVEWISKQAGYGLNKDWFVQELPLEGEF